MPVIDIHPHIVSPDTKKYPLDPLGGTQSTWSSERPTTYQDMIKSMDEAGVDKSALVHSSTAYGYDNSYVADAVAAVPSRFTGVYSIDVMAPNAVETFDYWLGRGCTGMRLLRLDRGKDASLRLRLGLRGLDLRLGRRGTGLVVAFVASGSRGIIVGALRGIAALCRIATLRRGRSIGRRSSVRGIGL